MRENDVIVIGGGLAGLTAAAVAAKAGKKVMMLTMGAGSLTIGGGIVDILGYLDGGKPVATPVAGMAQLAEEHPYSKIGQKGVEAATNFFKEIAESEGYPYIGSLDNMQWIPTAAGTVKPTCFVPKTMDTAKLNSADTVVVVGFKGLKDFYPQLIAKNLKNVPGFDKNYEVVEIALKLDEGRDISSLDVARYLDTVEGRQDCIAQMSKTIKPGSVVIIPPVLGTNPDYTVADAMQSALNCTFVETAAVPPSITGLRLRKMMLSYIKKLGVRVVEQATVAKSVIENGKCTAVITQGIDRERTYYAKSFVLANGGFYGGGLVAEAGRAIEPIFNLPIEAPTDHEEWTNKTLFSNQPQPFAKLGVVVDSSMRPVDANGKVLLNNVFVAGCNLRGYDFSFEKSGNGVAIASGYQAAMSL